MDEKLAQFEANFSVLDRYGVKITDEEKAREHYKRVTESIDKAKLKDDLKSGVALDYAELVQTESLRIR